MTGFTAPRPVRNKIRYSPGRAGEAVETKLQSALWTRIGSPLPSMVLVNSLGALATTVTVAGELRLTAVRTRTWTWPETPNGIWALICFAETKKSGIACPSTSTDVRSEEHTSELQS